MAWKQKNSNTTVDESPQADDESSNGPVSASQYDRPVGTGSQESDYSEFNNSERTVMLLKDSDYIPGLIPSAPPMHDPQAATSDEADLFPVTSDEDLDRYLRGEQPYNPNAANDESSVAVDLDAVPVAAAPSVDLDEPAHVGSRIDFDDAVAHSQPIELDELPVSPQPVNLDNIPLVTAHSDFGGTPVESPQASSDDFHSQSAGIDLDDLPSPTVNAAADTAHRPGAGIDIDDLPSASVNAAVEDTHGTAGAIDLDDSPVGAIPASGDVHNSPMGIDIDSAIDAGPATPPQPVNGAQAAHRPIDAVDDDSNFFASALDASDAAVASFRSAAEEAVASPADPKPAQAPDDHPAGTAAMENWDLDAFAPYLPPGGVAAPVVEAATSAAPGEVPAEETIGDGATVSRLIVRLGQFSASYELTKGETTIGRPDPRTSVFPDVAVEWDDAVSRNHCRVLHKADGDYVEDTGSTNGTRLNDKPLTPYQPVVLTDGDRIGVGEKTDISYLK